MVLTPKDVLLLKKSFAQFKTKLSTWDVKKKYKQVPSSQLEGADPPTVADLIVECYHYNYGITVSLAVIDAINEKKIREDLLKVLEGWSSEDFFDRHRSDLLGVKIRVDPILYYLHYLNLLTDEQYKDLTKQPTYKRKMEGLLDTIRCWDETSKCKVHQALECYNPEVREKLNTAHIIQNTIEEEGRLYCGYSVFPPYIRNTRKGLTKDAAKNHFLDRYEEKLINSIKMVDPVLDDLHDQQLLTQKPIGKGDTLGEDEVTL
ncbi:apoptosis-associated speck-like protein containing a CARD [Pyxicephalus adspersus]|uniref:apoptosis-associated speck-like protein containing a CARD n=1 Tax=Pyxicephalus adspersus TaxID=30357 RepID=UPI003B5B36DD